MPFAVIDFAAAFFIRLLCLTGHFCASLFLTLFWSSFFAAPVVY
jgi:hypothetical protein